MSEWALILSAAHVHVFGSGRASRPMPERWYGTHDKKVLYEARSRLEAALSWAGFESNKHSTAHVLLPPETLNEKIVDISIASDRPAPKPWLSTYSMRLTSEKRYVCDLNRAFRGRFHRLLKASGVRRARYYSPGLLAASIAAKQDSLVLFAAGPRFLKLVSVREGSPVAIFTLAKEHLGAVCGVIERAKACSETTAPIVVLHLGEVSELAECAKNQLERLGHRTVEMFEVLPELLTENQALDRLRCEGSTKVGVMIETVHALFRAGRPKRLWLRAGDR